MIDSAHSWQDSARFRTLARTLVCSRGGGVFAVHVRVNTVYILIANQFFLQQSSTTSFDNVTGSDCLREELNEKDELILSLNMQLKQLQVRLFSCFTSHNLYKLGQAHDGPYAEKQF